MIAATQEQQQQTTVTAPSVEEEALKRNTDCVYFLASPLTCKKGSECEYRHSEYARVNPRDCYYWLNGNCLNPKCGFRHPPLDGLFGTQASASVGSSLPPSHMAGAPAIHTPQNSGKQGVPCIFFQKGLCLKGDRCAFLHGPNPTGNKVMIPLSTELPPHKKPAVGQQKLTQEQKIPQTKFSKVVEVPAEAKAAPKQEICQPRNGSGYERKLPPSRSLDDELPKSKITNISPVVSGNSSRFNRLLQSQVLDDHAFQNGKDADEFLKESSPGFDVLVDDELRNSNYYHGEDQYGRRGHEGRNLNPVDEYDIGHSAAYSSAADIDREAYPGLRGFDTYEHMQGQYDWGSHRTSTERMLMRPVHLEHAGYSKADSPEINDESDLRYRLSKQRRVNGLRSVVSHDFIPDNHAEERSYRGSSRRDSHNLPALENGIGSRLRGRIKLPGRSSSGSDFRVEKEIENGRNRGILSPVRSKVPSHQGRLHDRIKASVEEEYGTEERNLRGPRMRREMTDDRSIDFAGPKSLAALKGTKTTEAGEVHLRKRKQLEVHQQSEGELSFEGPMPLSEILKRKRGAEAAASGSKDSKESKENLLGSSNNAGSQGGVLSIKDNSNMQVLKDEEESKEENTEVVALGQYSSQHEPETDDFTMEDHEYEAEGDDQGDYEYEQADEGGEYYEDGGNAEAEAEEEFAEDEDGDDFAKKIGIMFP